MSSCGTGILGVALHQSYLNTSVFYTSPCSAFATVCALIPEDRANAPLRSCVRGRVFWWSPLRFSPFISNACRFLSCSLSLNVHAIHVHTHIRRVINTLPQEFLLCLGGNYVIIPCKIMPVMPVHTGLSTERPVGVLQSCDGNAGIQAGYCGSITYGNGQPDAPLWALFKLPLP